MSSPSGHRRSDANLAIPDARDADGEKHSSRIRITVIVQNRYTFDAGPVTGKQIKQTAHVPVGFDLYRRGHGGNERIPDDAEVELHEGDHFFARPSTGAS